MNRKYDIDVSRIHEIEIILKYDHNIPSQWNKVVDLSNVGFNTFYIQ